MVAMTRLSFRVDEREALELQRWAQRLGVDRSELFRAALHQHLVRLASGSDADRWAERPLDEAERVFASITDWGPGADWSDWR